MKRSALIFVLLMLVSVSIQAQDTPSDWPPNPVEIFAPGVEILQTNVRGDPLQIPQPKPWDDDLRLVYVDDSETGERRSFPYPDKIVEAGWPTTLEDGTIIFSATEQIWGSEATRRWVWTLNPATGEFQRYDWLCGQPDKLYKEAVLERAWVIIENTDTKRAQLCEVATGKLSAPLPGDMNWPILDLGYNKPEISISPDGNWLLFWGQIRNDPHYLQAFAYSYELATDKLRRLGAFMAYIDSLSFGPWIGKQFLMRVSDMGEWQPRYVYIGNPAQADSLELAVTRVRYQPEYKDDPPRFDYITGNEGGDGPPHCSWITYLIETHQKTEYDMGAMCKLEFGSLGGKGYYRELTNIHNPTANLVRFNPITGERKDLFTGEIESIEWVSEGEHYAILTLDSDGYIETPPSMPTYLWAEPKNPHLSYIDLATGKTLFDVYAGWEWDGLGVAGFTSIISPQNDDSFLAYVQEKECCPYEPGYVSRFELVNGQYIETRLVDNFAMVLGDDKLLVWADGKENSQQLSVYNLKTSEMVPITLDVNKNQYQIVLDTSLRLDEHRLNILVVPADENYWDPKHSVAYTVRIP